MNWKLTLSYDGTSFHGWQIQPTLPTIQGTLATALHHITGETVLPQGSGRTDAGVHALAQVASFTLQSPIPAPNLLRALNRALPPSIRILTAEEVSETFHARHSARGKTYLYRIFQRRPNTADVPDLICPPFLAPYVWNCRWPLTLDPMQAAAALLLGTHEFTSFAAAVPDLTQRSIPKTPGGPFIDGPIVDEWGGENALNAASGSPEASRYPKASALGLIGTDEEAGFSPWGMPSLGAPNPTKTITHSAFTLEDNLLTYRITGNGFLHHMVRNIVGTLAEIGRGALTPQDIPTILAKKDRSVAGPTAPASGLFLHSVSYDSEASR